jgi:hypothetical protein
MYSLKTFFKRPNAFLVFLIFSTCLCYVGYQWGNTSENATPKAQITIPFLLGLTIVGAGAFNFYIDLQIGEETKEEKRKLKEQYNSDEIQKKQLLYFLSLVDEQLELKQVAYNSALKLDDETEGAFKDRLKIINLEFQNSQEAVSGLLFSYKQNGREIYLLKSIVITALEGIGISKPEPGNQTLKLEYQAKVNHLSAYLRAWLVCGIRYNIHNLPIQWIKETALSLQEQIDALKYIKNNLLEDEKVTAHIPKEEVRKLISKYLDELIRELQITR